MTARNSTTKRCLTCKQIKPVSEFYKYTKYPDGLLYECKACRRAYNNRAYHAVKDTPKQKRANFSTHLRTRYGISIDHYESLLASQGGVCAICGMPPGQGAKHGKRLHVDHCHETNRIRGLLCIHCNRALGSLGDNVAGLMRAVQYLQCELDLSPPISNGVRCGP